MTTISRLTSSQVGIAHGFRSGLEDSNASVLARHGHPVLFESFKVPYRVEKSCTYTPDFPLRTGVIVETKGRFVTADRQKHLMIAKQHPDLEIRFVFSRSAARISKQSSTTYAMWCEKNGFEYADKVIPKAWLEEATNRKSLNAMRALFEAQGKEFPF